MTENTSPRGCRRGVSAMVSPTSGINATSNQHDRLHFAIQHFRLPSLTPALALEAALLRKAKATSRAKRQAAPRLFEVVARIEDDNLPFLLKHVIELGFHQLLERFPATAGRFERQRQAAKIANERAALDIACAHRFPRLRHKRA